MADNMKLTVQS